MPEDAANGLVTDIGHTIRGNLPELWVEDLERDVPFVTDPCKVVEDRPDLEIPLAGEDAVAVAGQLARGPAQVADLHPGEVFGRQIREVLELARAGVVVEQVEADAHALGATLRDQGERRVEAGAELGPLLELQRQADAEPSGGLGRLGQRGGGAAVVVGVELMGKIGCQYQERHLQLLEQGQPAAKVIPVRRSLGPAREQ